VSFGPASPDAGVELLRQLFLQCRKTNYFRGTINVRDDSSRRGNRTINRSRTTRISRKVDSRREASNRKLGQLAISGIVAAAAAGTHN
jgi:hypothetical protein